VTNNDFNGWEEVKDGCVFASLQGSLFVDNSLALVVFTDGERGGRIKATISLPPGVKIIVDPKTREIRGLMKEDTQNGDSEK
jgi:hypothetical protein